MSYEDLHMRRPFFPQFLLNTGMNREKDIPRDVLKTCFINRTVLDRKKTHIGVKFVF